MPKICLFLFFIASFYCKSYSQIQPYTYSYEVTYKMTGQKDSTDIKSRESEFTTLLIGENQSVFCATRYLMMDSAVNAEKSRGNRLGPSMAWFQANGTHNNLVIFKMPELIRVVDLVLRYTSSQPVTYTESNNLFDWKVLPDTTIIGQTVCQKAETNFGGRQWIAWFAPSIPVSDGPYKFNGLPGLILKIYDSKKYWSFDLVSLRAINKSIRVSFRNKIPTPIKDKAEFFRRRKNNMENRLQLQKQSGARFGAEEAKYATQFEEEAKKDNNWIELYQK